MNRWLDGSLAGIVGAEFSECKRLIDEGRKQSGCEHRVGGEGRGRPRKRSGEPRPFKEVCDDIAKLAKIDAVEGIALRVMAKP
jgi:hypothetical protein